MNITFKPLPAVWLKPPTTKRRRSPFKYRWDQTLRELERELRHLGTTECSVALDIQLGDVRRDGWPRADVRPRTPAVIISFTAHKLNGAPVQVYPCDTFGFWQDNIVAVVRSLEKLRAVDRYGVTVAGEQYAGFKALPASTEPAKMTVDEAAEVLASHSDLEAPAILSFESVARIAVRTANSRTHPDGEDGGEDSFKSVQEARVILGAHHGVSL